MPDPNVYNIALVGDYVPRKCGIATFTRDLLEALATESPNAAFSAVVMNDTPEGYHYPPQVRFEVMDRQLSDYQLAADFLNVSQVNVVSLQHEYGIYGGHDGAHVLAMLRSLRMPIVATLHTVLFHPSPGQKEIMEDLGKLCAKLVVMSDRAQGMLHSIYGIPEEKVVKIPHGIPDFPFVDPNFYKDQFGVEGQKVILTFGLLSPGKGVEYMIDAMPDVVRKHPDAVYIVLGATHPRIVEEQGEFYRFSLQRRARDLGVEKNVIFHNRYVEMRELSEFLGAADIYVTPYLGEQQIVSGTLAYALGAGKATISTPYWYAEEMLADGRGRLVPFRDSTALAQQVNDLLDNETERHAMRKRAYSYCREMIWKEVARQYMGVFLEVERKRLRHPSPEVMKRARQAGTFELPQLNFEHLRRLTDDAGLLQHAKFIVPDRGHGYCTDDNARALIAVLLAQELSPESEELLDLGCRYLSFLYYAFNEDNGRFRNFMAYDRRWVEEAGSEDSHGRAIWALGNAIALERPKELGNVALAMFERAINILMGFEHPRSLALGLVGIQAYLRRFSGDSEVRRIRELLANRLLESYKRHATPEWPWFLDTVTYDNGKLPQALLMCGQWMQRGDMVDAGLASLEWLMKIQTDSKGHFIPIGNQGWLVRGGGRARFDQQPLEAQSIQEACIEAFRVTRDHKWLKYARCCLEWFLGRNDHNAPLYDHKTGGCCDGLMASGPNLNQGAESTLAWLLTLLNMYSEEEALAGE